MKTASWIVIDKATGEAVLETFEQSTADAINRDKFDVLPALQYLQQLNRNIKEAQK
jgi:hypothetical protein